MIVYKLSHVFPKPNHHYSHVLASAIPRFLCWVILATVPGSSAVAHFVVQHRLLSLSFLCDLPIQKIPLPSVVRSPPLDSFTVHLFATLLCIGLHFCPDVCQLIRGSYSLIFASFFVLEMFLQTDRGSTCRYWFASKCPICFCFFFVVADTVCQHARFLLRLSFVSL